MALVVWVAIDAEGVKEEKEKEKILTGRVGVNMRRLGVWLLSALH